MPHFDMEAIAYVYLVLVLDHGRFLVPHIQNSDKDIHLDILSLGIKTKSERSLGQVYMKITSSGKLWPLFQFYPCQTCKDTGPNRYKMNPSNQNYNLDQLNRSPPGKRQNLQTHWIRIYHNLLGSLQCIQWHNIHCHSHMGTPLILIYILFKMI